MNSAQTALLERLEAEREENGFSTPLCWGGKELSPGMCLSTDFAAGPKNIRTALKSACNSHGVTISTTDSNYTRGYPFFNLCCVWCDDKDKRARRKDTQSIKLGQRDRTRHKTSRCPFSIRMIFRSGEGITSGWYVKSLCLQHRGHFPLRVVLHKATDEQKDRIAELRLSHTMDYSTILSLMAEAGLMCTSKQAPPFPPSLICPSTVFLLSAFSLL